MVIAATAAAIAVTTSIQTDKNRRRNQSIRPHNQLMRRSQSSLQSSLQHQLINEIETQRQLNAAKNKEAQIEGFANFREKDEFSKDIQTLRMCERRTSKLRTLEIEAENPCMSSYKSFEKERVTLIVDSGIPGGRVGKRSHRTDDNQIVISLPTSISVAEAAMIICEELDVKIPQALSLGGLTMPMNMTLAAAEIQEDAVLKLSCATPESVAGMVAVIHQLSLEASPYCPPIEAAPPAASVTSCQCTIS